MAIEDKIKQTIKRFANVTEMLFSGEVFDNLIAGISVEFGRVLDYFNTIKSATIAQTNTDSDTLDDLEEKYGITYATEATDAERVARIEERAGGFGSGSAAWLQEQIQTAGFDFYVIENTKGLGETTQFGDTEFSTATQFETMPSRVDPSTVPGILVTTSASASGGKVVVGASQFDGAQFGYMVFGTANPDYAYPQPAERDVPTDAQKWGYVFFLSPFSDRLATSSELVYMSDENLDYLIRLIMRLKFVRNWCILQAGENVIRVDDAGETRTLEDGTTVRRA